MIKSYLYTILLLSLTALSINASPALSEDSLEKENLIITKNNIKAVQQQASKYSKAGNLDQAVNLYEKIIDYSIRKNNIYLQFDGTSNIAQLYLKHDNYKLADEYIKQSLDIWDKNQDQFKKEAVNLRPVYIMYNALAIYESNVNMNFDKATEYIIAGLNMVREQPDNTDYAILARNLVTIFFIRQNPAGLKYAQEIYNDGKDRQNDFLTSIGAFGSAVMFTLSQEYDDAYSYMQEAEHLRDDNAQNIFFINTIYANIFAGQNNADSARHYYTKAYNAIKLASATDAIYLSLSYGSFLRQSGNITQAEDVFLKGIHIANQTNNRVFTFRIYEELSKLYSDMGKMAEALTYYKMYHDESSSIFNIEQERAINDLTFKYEEERHKSELQNHQIQLIKQAQRFKSLLFILLIIAGASIVFFIMYRKTNKMYTKIALQYKRAIDTETNLTGQIDQLNSQLLQFKQKDSVNDVADNQSNDSDNGNEDFHNEDLFNKIESIIKSEQLYKDSTLTRDKVAELLGSNRTYISRAVNENSGMTFNQYINIFRIKESLVILSNPHENIPLKALSQDIGFGSITTFYDHFKKEVGMTPAKYRERIQELAKQ